MALIEKLSWDSEFFGLNIGRICINQEQLFNPDIFLSEASAYYDLVYVFSKQILSVGIIDKGNLNLVDMMITMSQPLLPQGKNNDYQILTKPSDKELEECYKIAEQTSEVSRFYYEPLIGKEKANNLYRKWIDNSLNQQFADGVLVEKSEDTITGIHIVKTIEEENIGLCSLIGVNNKFKGLGLGRNLWNQAFGYWNQIGSVNKCKVSFSIKNSGSFNFHLKMGFNKVEEIKYIYHYRNHN